MDAFRYFLLREMAFGQDATFSEDAFVTRVNADLANNLGNLVSRTLAMQQRYFDGAVQPLGEWAAEDRELADAFAAARSRRCRGSSSSWPSTAPSKRCGAPSTTPTSTSSPPRRSRWPRTRRPSRAPARCCTICSKALFVTAVLLRPFLPETSARMLGLLDRAGRRDAAGDDWHGARRFAGRARHAQAGDAVPAHRD